MKKYLNKVSMKSTSIIVQIGIENKIKTKINKVSTISSSIIQEGSCPSRSSHQAGVGAKASHRLHMIQVMTSDGDKEALNKFKN